MLYTFLFKGISFFLRGFDKNCPCEEVFVLVFSIYSVMFQHSLSNSLQYTYLFYFFLL